MKTVKIKKAGTYDFTISEKSTDTVYSVSPDVAGSVTLNFKPGTLYLVEKTGNDVIYNFMYDNGMISITIKDYYKYYQTNNDFLKINSITQTPGSIASVMELIKGEVSKGYYQNSAYNESVAGNKKSDYYNMTVGKESETILDFGGNDTYNLQAKYTNTGLTVRDKAGNDKYITGNETTVNVHDEKGNDNYDLGYNSKSTIEDDAGNDNYNFTNTYQTTVNDASGNDKYNINSIKGDLILNDLKGSDKYTVKNSYLTFKINDDEGNDIYNLDLAYGGYKIKDKKGNDNYIAKGINGLNYIEEYTGNDSYKIFSCNTSVYIYDGINKDAVENPLDSSKLETDKDKSGNDKYDISLIRDYTHIYDTSGTETYNISGVSGEIYIEDGYKNSNKGGNDKYNIKQTFDDVTIKDYFGNEKYNVSGVGNEVEITDCKGVDNYNINNVNDSVEIIDIGGEDKYNISKIGYKVSIIDGGESAIDSFVYNYLNNSNSGNDKYNISEVVYDDILIYDYTGNEAYKISYAYDDAMINDYSGNDKYDISHVYNKVKINDFGGDDKYNLLNAANPIIIDLLGADTYNISNASYCLQISDGFNIFDNIDTAVANSILTDIKQTGNDKYNLNYLKGSANLVEDAFGDEKYSINNSYYVSIVDKQGRDNYTFNSTNLIVIDDGDSENLGRSLNDVYKITNCAGVNITDYDNNDSYILNNVQKGEIDNVITDNSGEDEYNLTNSAIAIVDKGTANDKYTIKKLTNRVSINDAGGNNDKLTLSSTNKNNIIYVADFKSGATKDDKVVNSGSVFIFDKTTTGCVKIENFFSTYQDNSKNYINASTVEDGYIENIMTGKNNLVADTSAFINNANADTIVEATSAWLSANAAFTNVADVFNNASGSQMADFIATLTTTL